MSSETKQEEASVQAPQSSKQKPNRGKFITVEGIDGSGKSSCIPEIKKFLEAEVKVNVVLSREPGGTLVGEELRKAFLLDAMHPETEVLMVFAARREHIDKVIEPALARGDWVVCDRFTDSTFAYQGGGRGVPIEKLEQLEKWVQGSLQPDLTLYFDLPVKTAQMRLATSRGESLDRIELETIEFARRVKHAYDVRVSLFPERFEIVDASGTMQDTMNSVRYILEMRTNKTLS